jgi:hypothetical protein
LKGQHFNKSRQAPDEAAGHESLHVLLYTIINILLKRLSDQIGTARKRSQNRPWLQRPLCSKFRIL